MRPEMLGEQLHGSIVATDTGRHGADVEALIARGPVLCEKPLVANSDELGVLRAIAATSRYPIFCAYCLRFSQALRTFAVHLPRIGPPHQVRIECESYLPDWRPGTNHQNSYAARPAEGGVLRDLSHEVDYAIWLFGRPSAVWADLRATGRLGIESDDLCDLGWTTPSGTTVSIHLNYLTRKPRRTMRAAGPLGEITWDGVRQTVSVDLIEGSEVFDCSEAKDAMYERQADAFINVSDSAGSSLATFAEAAFVVELIDASMRSSKLGGRVPIISTAADSQ